MSINQSYTSNSNDTSKDVVVSLLQFLDLSQLTCLNESPNHTFESIVSRKAKNTSDNYLLSDSDEQLLLSLPFIQGVRIQSIVIQTQDVDRAPSQLKLVVNRTALGFEDVENADEPQIAQNLTVSVDEVKNGTPIALRYVRFQAVNTLHIFVQSNHGKCEESRIDRIDVLGVPVETTKNLIGLKNIDE